MYLPFTSCKRSLLEICPGIMQIVQMDRNGPCNSALALGNVSRCEGGPQSQSPI